MRVLLVGSMLLVAAPASAQDLAAKVKELEAQLAAARAEIATLKKQSTYFVHCERNDLYRDPRRVEDSGDLEQILDRLVPLGVDPAIAPEDVGRNDPAPIAYRVKAGCAFLGGDRITEIDGVPVSDRSRVRALLSSKNEWRFTVSERPNHSKKVSVPADTKGFDLGVVLKLRKNEAQLVPTMVEGQERGFVVWSVAPGGILEKAGLKVRDVVIEVNGKPLTHSGAQKFITEEWTNKGRLDVVLERDGRRFELTPIVGR